MKTMATRMYSAINRKKALPSAMIALILGILALCFVIPGVAFQAAAAQESGSGGGHRRGMHSPEQQLKGLTRRLNLTEDQQDKIKPILKNQHKQMMSLREDTSLTRDEKRSKFMEIRKNAMQQIQANLTPDQLAKFQQMEQRREQRMKARQEKQEGGNTDSAPQP